MRRDAQTSLTGPPRRKCLPARNHGMARPRGPAKPSHQGVPQAESWKRKTVREMRLRPRAVKLRMTMGGHTPMGVYTAIRATTTRQADADVRSFTQTGLRPTLIRGLRTGPTCWGTPRALRRTCVRRAPKQSARLAHLSGAQSPRRSLCLHTIFDPPAALRNPATRGCPKQNPGSARLSVKCDSDHEQSIHA